MQIHTYTNVWSTKKQIYSIWDWSLPKPVSLIAVALFVGTAVVWVPLLFTLGVPVASPVGFVSYLAMPAAVAIIGDKPMFEGKSIVGFLVSIVNYAFQPRVWTALRDDTDFRKDTHHVTSTAWLPKNERKKNG